jgi:type II secretory pathway pseudopilin PulG
MKKFLQKLVAFGQRKGSLRSKRSIHRKGLSFGFTLIELLVAALIASLLVAVMLSFLVGVLDSDRKETAKSNAQEELQAAMAYISDDMQEAIYIYGADALLAINGATTATQQLPHTQSDPKNECNKSGVNTCTPILVFWKRYNYNPTSSAKYSAPPNASEKIGCMPYTGTPLTDCQNATTPFGRDTYTFSLVAYYLKDDTNLGSTTWSNTARILRWELKDGYAWSCSNGKVLSIDSSGNATAPPECPTTFTQRATKSSPLITSPITLVDNSYYFITPDKGFNRPDFTSTGSLSTLAGLWKKFDSYDFGTNPFTTLVDFMDDTGYNANQGGDNNGGAATSATAASAIKIPIGKNITLTASGLTAITNLDCDDPSVGVGNTNPASATNISGTVTQRVPADFNDTTINPSKLSSFYACVAPENVTARIFMRGNALARLGVIKANRTPSTNNLTFLPTADVRSFGRSAIGLKKK